jgi:hypothetical protein
MCWPTWSQFFHALASVATLQFFYRNIGGQKNFRPAPSVSQWPHPVFNFSVNQCFCHSFSHVAIRLVASIHSRQQDCQSRSSKWLS